MLMTTVFTFDMEEYLKYGWVVKYQQKIKKKEQSFKTQRVSSIF